MSQTKAVKILLPYTRRQISISLVGFILSYILSLIKLTYPYNVELNLSQIGIFIAACSGGPIVGAITGLIGALQTQPIYIEYDVMIFYALLGLLAGGLSSRIRPLYSTIISWLIIGLTIYLTSQFYTIIITKLHWIIVVNTYLILAGALAADLVATYLGSSRNIRVAKTEAAAKKRQTQPISI